jgi:hypothetical protein
LSIDDISDLNLVTSTAVLWFNVWRIHKKCMMLNVKAHNGKCSCYSGVYLYGLGRANPGAPNPNGPNGGPQGQVVEQKHWPGPLICHNVVLSFSDHQNSVKCLPKVREMAFQRV